MRVSNASAKSRLQRSEVGFVVEAVHEHMHAFFHLLCFMAFEEPFGVELKRWNGGVEDDEPARG